MGGSLGRREATGRGCMMVTRAALTHLGMPIAGATVAVQGFGNVGSVTADLLQKEGCRIVADRRSRGRGVQRARHRCHEGDRAREDSTSRSRASRAATGSRTKSC